MRLWEFDSALAQRYCPQCPALSFHYRRATTSIFELSFGDAELLHYSVFPLFLHDMDKPFVLAEISFLEILKNEACNLNSFYKACSSEGCFYLDIGTSKKGASAVSLIDMADAIMQMAGFFFALPLEEKLEWEMDKWSDMQIGGYKAAGKHTGVVKGGRDGFENFLVPLNAILELDTKHPEWPPALASNLTLLKAFERSCQGVTHHILSALSSVMPTKMAFSFEDLHRERELSSTSLAMLQYLPKKALAKDQIGHMAHTDAGSLTLLFTSAPGLQIYHHDSSSWIPVEPRPGKILVHIGDALSFMSGKVLRSCLHRVVPSIEGSKPCEPRSSLAFFLRPELLATFIDGDGKEWTGADWHRAKYKIFRAKNNEQEKTSLLTGMTGFLGLSEYTQSYQVYH